MNLPNIHRKHDSPYTRNVGLFSSSKSNIEDKSQHWAHLDNLSSSLSSMSSSSRFELAPPLAPPFDMLLRFLSSSSDPSRGRSSIAMGIPFKTIAEIIHMAPFHVYSSIRNSLSGANTKPPIPLPHTAIPVANARFFLK